MIDAGSTQSYPVIGNFSFRIGEKKTEDLPIRTDRKAVRDAVTRAGSKMRAVCYMFRYPFAIHLFEGGYDIRRIQELLDHSDIKTMVSTRVLKGGPTGIRRSVDGFSGKPRGRYADPHKTPW